MKFEKVIKPSKNFNILGYITFLDPIDGKEKLALHSFSATKLSKLILVDPTDMSGQSYEMAGDAGAWALCQADENTLLVGSCSFEGDIYRFDLRERKFVGEPIKSPKDTSYIWTLAKGSDGLCYGGTYSDCILLQFNPVTNELVDLGRVDPDTKNVYSRHTFGQVPGRIFVNTGYSTPNVFYYDLSDQKFHQFHKSGFNIRLIGERFVCVFDKDQNHFLLDPITGEELYKGSFKLGEIKEIAGQSEILADLYVEYLKVNDERAAEKGLSKCLRLENGDLFGIEGQEIYKIKKGENEPSFYPIPGDAPTTSVLTINVADDGKVWGVSSFGMTAFSYDPVTGENINTLGVTTSSGECYGCVPYNGHVYFTSYAAGEHIKYNPSAPWKMRENVNPKMILSVAPKYIRPHSRSILDEDGYIWTAWMRNYGDYGSCISKWDTKTDEITVFEDLVPEFAIEEMAFWKEFIIFTNYKVGNGLPVTKDAVCPIHKMNKDGKIIQTAEYKGILGNIAIVGDFGVVRLNDELCKIDCETLELTPLGISFTEENIRIVRYKENVIAATESMWYLLSPESGKVLQKSPGTGTVVLDICVKKDDIWMTDIDGWLYKVIL